MTAPIIHTDTTSTVHPSIILNRQENGYFNGLPEQATAWEQNSGGEWKRPAGQMWERLAESH